MTRLTNFFWRETGSGFRLASVIGVLPLAVMAASSSPGEPSPKSSLGMLPLCFEANLGQGYGGFDFIARGRNCNFFVAPAEAVLTLTKYETSTRAASPRHPVPSRVRQATRELRLEFVGADPAAAMSGTDELPGRVNYFLGNDSSQWRTGVPLFARVRVEQLYPGVDLIYYGNERRLEYDFVVAPQADAGNIILRFSGADRIHLNTEEDLIFTLGNDEIRQPKPFVYQDVNGVRMPVTGRYVLSGSGTVTFQLGDYDRRLPLVIDPVLSYASYFGGSGADLAWDVAVDADGFVYMAGESMGGLPVRSTTMTNASSGSDRAQGDAFVAKFDNAGTNLIYLAYIGGRMADAGLSVAVDAAGSAYLTGYTESTNFPTANALFPALKGQPYPGLNTFPPDAFVTKLSPSGSALLYSTYLGGAWLDVGSGIAIDAAGNAYVAGYTESTNFVTASVSSALTHYGGRGDAFVAKLDAAGTNLLYSLYLGGSRADVGWDVAANGEGVAFVTGSTSSTDFPAANLLAGGHDAFVTTVATESNQAYVAFSEFIGGREDSLGYRITTDGNTGIYVVGSTTADATFPVTPSILNPGGVFRSDNGATNWNLWSTGLVSVVVEGLALDPSNPANLFAGTGHGIGQSLDGGSSWFSPVPLSTNAAGLAPAGVVDRVRTVAVAPGTPPAIYAGVPTEGVAKSPDGGTNWFASVGLVNRIVEALAVDPQVPTTVYAGTDAGVFKTSDAGTNWNGINGGLGNTFVRALALNPALPSTLYAGTAGGVYRSSDGGTNWAAFNTGLTELQVLALAIHPTTPTTLFAGTEGGLFKSINSGTNWSRLITDLVGVLNFTALAIDPITPATVYAGTTNGLFKSIDGGDNWLANNHGLLARHILTLAINPAAPATLYAGTKGDSVFGGKDAFVSRAGTNGYFAILGGAGEDEGRDVAVDGEGRVHLTGTTVSKDFPTQDVLGILRSTNSGGSDGFVAQLSGDGGTLEHSAYLGGSGADAGYGIALDAQGNSFVVGATASVNFPTYDAYQTNAAGDNDAFLVKIIGENRPMLTISASTNAVDLAIVRWPAYWTGFTLQTIADFSTTNLVSTNLAGTNVIVSTNLVFVNQWEDITNFVPAVVDGAFEIGVRRRADFNSLFIRLRR